MKVNRVKSAHDVAMVMVGVVWQGVSGRGQEEGGTKTLFPSMTRKVDVRLPGKGNSNSHGARPVHLIITMMKWILTSRLSTKKSLSSSINRVKSAHAASLVMVVVVWQGVSGRGQEGGSTETLFSSMTRKVDVRLPGKEI